MNQNHSSQSFVTQQLPQRSNENIRLEMEKLIKNNQIILNNNVFPHEEASMKVLLAKERIFKLIQAWDKKQNDLWNLPALLLQLLNDSQTIDVMFKQQPEEIPELMCKLLEDVQNIREELAEYINSSSWNSPTLFYDNDEEYSIQYKEYLDKFPDAVTPVLPTEEPEYSLSMGYEHLSIIPETESDEVKESSAKNLLPIPSEYEVTSDDESECDVPVKDDSSPAFTTFSNPLFKDNDDFTSSDDESLLDEDVSIEEFKFDYLKEFSGAFMPTSIADEERIRREHTLPTSPIPIEDSDSQREEIDIFTGTDELLPPDFKSDDYDSEGDIYFLEELLVDDSIPFPKNELSNFDYHDDSSFPRPPPEPPDDEFF
uniref:Reverse transcriptase domain-containing protein n=1 Tax=Tanacetum cinerariifolium TaxID=118510 RepID=A0A699GND2_TANCI|nr:hypothetical protein [Tanacetum cinerariifolium]